MEKEFDFYDRTSLKSYNLNESIYTVKRDLLNIAQFVLIYTI